MSFICPACRRESFHPKDEEYRYCSACNVSWPDVVNDDGFINVDVLGSLNMAHAAAYSLMHMELVALRAQHPEAFELALLRAREQQRLNERQEQCRSETKNSGQRESWREKLRRALRR